MKGIILLFILCSLAFAGCKTSKPAAGLAAAPQSQPEVSAADNPQPVNFADQATWILGYFNLSRLKQEPYSTWFYKGYDEYQVNPEALQSLKGIGMEGLGIKIVMGTWCPDSRREVPRFMKILDSWQFPSGRLTFIGVDDGKLSPVGEYEQLEIQRVPTFIIYKNNIEAGRIIENPVTSLEQDMVNILRGMNNNK